MARSLPPLNALRAFEAAARHLSFTLAADELHVTQAAISHQVKGLEEILGIALFRRLPRRLYLTEEGQALLPELTAGFDRLAQAVARIGRQGRSGPLTVTLLTTFALGWLVPRLLRFQARHPEIDVHLSTSARIVDFTREELDCGVRHGLGNWPGLAMTKVMDSYLTPLCPPAVAARLKRYEDLRTVPVVHAIGPVDEWNTWLEAAGIPGLPLKKGAAFDSTMIAVQAAMGGPAVAIGDPRFYPAELASGRLVQPFGLVVPEDKAWWFVCLPAMESRPKIEAFRDWLLEEAAQTPPPDGCAGEGAAAGSTPRKHRVSRGI